MCALAGNNGQAADGLPAVRSPLALAPLLSRGPEVDGVSPDNGDLKRPAPSRNAGSMTLPALMSMGVRGTIRA